MKNYKNFLILERNLTNKIKKFANVPAIYNWANELDSDQAIWLSNVVVAELKKQKDSDDGKISVRNKKSKDDFSIETFLKNGTTGHETTDEKLLQKIKVIQRNNRDDITKVLHYVNSPLHTNKPNINRLSFEEALKISEEFHQKMKDQGHIIEDESGTIIMTFDDGYYWIDLESTSCSDESAAMGHCGNTNQGTTILSLRLNKKPHVSIAWNEDGNIFTQIKGKENTKPVEKYHEYIVDLIIKLEIGGFESEYDVETDFISDDLSSDLYDKLNAGNSDYIDNEVIITDEEIESDFRSLAENDIDQFIVDNPGDFWANVDNDSFVESFIEEQVSNSSARDYDASDLAEYFPMGHDDDIFDFIKENDFEDYKAYKDDPYDALTMIPDDMFQDLIDELDIEEDILNDCFEDITPQNAEDIYTEHGGGDAYDINTNDYMIIDIKNNYFDEEEFITDLMNNLTIEDMKSYLD